ncbi:MAG: universal stress protein [Ilumatobacter sp.]
MSPTQLRPWVVGHDGSDGADRAARWALRHAQGRTRRVHVVSAWNVPVTVGFPQLVPATGELSPQSLAAAAERSAAEVAASLPTPDDVEVTVGVREGYASAVLLGEAQHADLLVVGCRGLGGFSRLVMGSTSTQCATHATVPTAVIPESAPADDTSRILVAFDGSTNSVAAAVWALEFAPSGAVIDLVSVWDVAPIAVGSDQFFFPEASELAQQRFEQQVDSVQQGTTRSIDDVTIHRSFIEGRTRATLREAAADADLVVMGARGLGAVGSAVLGSVSTWILHHVDRAMVVVPAPGDGSVASAAMIRED